MEKLGEFDFEIQYVPGTENVLADALSRLWSNESPGTVRGRGAYTYHDVVNSDSLNTHGISMPVLVGMEASCLANDDGLEVCPMELRGSRRPSARARGLDNDIVPGRLNMRKRSVTRGQRKEGGKGITTAPALNTGNRSEKSAMPTLNTGSESVEPACNTGIDKSAETAYTLSPQRKQKKTILIGNYPRVIYRSRISPVM